MYVKFSELKERITYAQLVYLFELPGGWKGDNYRCKCPVCDTEDPRSLSITEGEGFTCFASDNKGDQIALAAHLIGLEGPGAMKKAAHYLQENLIREPPKKPEPKQEKKGKLQPLDYLVYEHEKVQELGLTPKLAESLGVGHAPKGMMRLHVVWPLYKEGVLAGYVGYKDGALKLPPNLKEA